MNQMDWKDALGKAFNVPVPDKNDPTAETAAPDAAAVRPRQGDALQQQGKQMLDVVLERKGRAGKQATIVTGFVCDEAALKEVASQLKRHLGVGGSARGGEILKKCYRFK